MRYLWLADVPQESQVIHSSDSIFLERSDLLFQFVWIHSSWVDTNSLLLAPLVLGQQTRSSALIVHVFYGFLEF